MDFNELSAFSIIAPLIVGAFFFRSIASIKKLLLLYIISLVIIEFSAMTLYRWKINNMPIYHIQSYTEFYFLLLIYYRLFREMRHQRFALIVGIAFLLASILMLFRDSIFEFNTGQRYVEMFLLFLLFLAYLSEQTTYNAPAQIRRNTFFWFTIGYMIYFAGTLLLFLSQEMFVRKGITGYWVIHGIFNIFLNLVFTFVLWSGREKSLS